MTCSGWWLAKKRNSSAQAWTPSAYLEEVISKPMAPLPPPAQAPRAVPAPPPTSNGVAATFVVAPNGAAKPGLKAKPTPPAPPAKRPGAKKPIGPSTTRDSGVNMTDSSGRSTPNENGGVSLAGGLAEAVSRLRWTLLPALMHTDG